MSTTTSSSSGPTSLETKIRNALTGVQQVIPAGSTVQMPGGAMTQAQLAQQLSGYLPPFQTVRNDKQAYAAAVAARTAMEPGARQFLENLRASLTALFGKGSLQLTKFGFGTGAHTAPTPQTQVVAAAKRTLTRQKRGTLGSKQKQQITVVSAPTVAVGGSGGSKPTITPPTVDATPALNTGSQSSTASTTPAPVAPAAAAVPSKS